MPPAADLDYDATDDVLVVSTLGRGAWRLQAGLTVVRQIEDMTAEVGSAELTVSLAGVFEDRTGGGLTYSVESADETIATVRIDGNMIRVAPRAAGVVAITVYRTGRQRRLWYQRLYRYGRCGVEHRRFRFRL